MPEFQKSTQTSPQKGQFRQKIKREYQENSNLSDLFGQSSKLSELYKNLEIIIKKKFTLLIEDGPSDPILLESIKTDIQIPEIVSIGGIDEIP